MIGTNSIELLKNYPYLDRVKLGQIFGKSGENLNYLIQKLLERKTLIPLKNGLYVSEVYLLTMEQAGSEREAYLEYLANVLRYPSYISLEYAAAKFGLIPESVFGVTSVSLKTTRSFETSLVNFFYRSVKEDLFRDFEYIKFRQFKVAIARPGKALFDLLYFRKFPPMEELRVNYGALDKLEKKYFENLMKKYDH